MTDQIIQGSPEYKLEEQRILREITTKFAWSAQHQGVVYVKSPAIIAPMKDYTFDRISKTHHSFHYQTVSGRKKKRYFSLNELVTAAEEDVDNGFLVIEGVEFMPGKGLVSADDIGRQMLNLWHKPEWNVSSDPSEPTWFIDHLRYLFEDHKLSIEHFLNFVAHMIQRPHERVNHALLITSQAKGIGKSTLGQVLCNLIGTRNAGSAQSKDLKGSFDGWLTGKLLIQVDEIYEHGNWDLANKLKPLITEPRISINIKYGPQLEISNYARFLIFSNHSAPIDLEEGDRRYFVFESRAQPRDPEYYDLFNSSANNPSELENLYSYLHRGDIWQFRPYAPPPLTEAKTNLIAVSGNPLIHYVAESVASGHFEDEFGGSTFTQDQMQRLLAKSGFGANAKSTKELGKALEAAGITSERVTVDGVRRRQWRLPPSGRAKPDNEDF